MLDNIMIMIVITLFVTGLYWASVRRKRLNRTNLVTPSTLGDDEEESDFICLHLGSKGTIASCGGVTVRATRIKKDNTK